MKTSSDKKIWLVSELFYPEQDSTAYIFTKIANYLTKEFDIRVICGPKFYKGNKKEIANDVELNQNIIVYRSRSINLNKNNLIQRTFRFIILSFQLSYMVIKKVARGEHVLIATNPAPLIVLIGFLKNFKSFKLHVLVHDVFPENTISAGIFPPKTNIIYKILKAIFNHAYNKADHIIVLGKDMKEVFQNKIEKKCKISIITNWADTKNIIPLKRTDSLIKTWGLGNKIILQFAGNIGRTQGLSEVIEALYLSRNKDIYLAIFGSGACEAKLKQFVKDNSIQNIGFYGNYSRMEQQQILNSCDIAIVSLSKGMYGLGVPSKTYNILAAGKPILFVGEMGSEISDLVIKEEIGWSINIDSRQQLIEFFSNLRMTNHRELTNMGIKAREIAEKKYSETIVLNNLLKSIKSFS